MGNWGEGCSDTQHYWMATAPQRQKVWPVPSAQPLAQEGLVALPPLGEQVHFLTCLLAHLAQELDL